MATPAKKPKMMSRSKQYFVKQAQIQHKKKNQLDVGMKGYFVRFLCDLLLGKFISHFPTGYIHKQGERLH